MFWLFIVGPGTVFAIRGFSPCRLEGKVFIDLEAWALGSFRAFFFGGFFVEKLKT